MKLFIKKYIFQPIKHLQRLFSVIFYKLNFKLRDIEYGNMPLIRGRLFIYNGGKCTLGNSLIFNSSLTSNLVGIYKPCTINVEEGAMLIIGDNCGFSGVSIYCADKIEIGKYLTCGGNVCIWDTDFHPIGHLDRRVHDRRKIASKHVKIGDDVFIGANSMILKGVEIGDRVVIGAGSIVTKSIPADELWAGNPAKFIKKLSQK